jgi:hypothetical protein
VGRQFALVAAISCLVLSAVGVRAFRALAPSDTLLLSRAMISLTAAKGADGGHRSGRSLAPISPTPTTVR